jgi:tetratricopeptide (TPR) repeat protein
MPDHFLNVEIHDQIKNLCAKGDELAKQRQFKSTFAFYRDALHLIPEPTQKWEATTWILAAIGDLYYLDAKFEKSLVAFNDAVGCAGGLGNPFIHLRIGECCFELGDKDCAADELTRAYMGAGTEIFQKEDPKYLEFLSTRIKPPSGQSKLEDHNSKNSAVGPPYL